MEKEYISHQVACMLFHTTPPKKKPAFLVCLVTPGNSRPIVEAPKEANSFLGAFIDPGYQSHFILTNRDGLPCTLRQDFFFNELVIDKESQIVPIFLVTVLQSSLLGLLKDYTREIVVNPEQDVAESRLYKVESEREVASKKRTTEIEVDSGYTRIV